MKEKLNDKSIKYSLRESITSNCSIGFGDHYFSPYIIALNARATHLAYLTSLTNIFAPLSQLLTQKLINKISRKVILILSLIFQIIFWFLIIIIPYFSIFHKWVLFLLIFLFVLYAFFGNLGAPAFVSWLGDLISEDKKGTYWGLRNSLGTTSFIFSVILAGLFLDFFKSHSLNNQLFGFAFIFILSIIFKTFSIFYFYKQHEPQFRIPKEKYFSFIEFLKKAPKRNFGRFTLWCSFLIFATNVAGPYYTLYILRDLKFSYTEFMLISTASAIASAFSFAIWGKLVDKFGSVAIVKFTSFLIPIIPLAWPFTIFMPSIFCFLFIFLLNLFGGIVWSGFEVARISFLYDAVTPPKRTLCTAYMNILNGISVAIGAFIGGELIELFENKFINSIMIVSIFSGFLRLFSAFLSLVTFQEKHILKRQFFYIIYSFSSEIIEFPLKILKLFKTEFDLIENKLKKLVKLNKNAISSRNSDRES